MMSTSTTNYNLTKLDGSDLGAIIDINGNADKIDAALKENRNDIERIKLAAKADYIVEKGVSGLWNFRKWSSGDIELYGQKKWTAAINSPLGNMYLSVNPVEASLPFELASIDYLSASSIATNHVIFGVHTWYLPSNLMVYTSLASPERYDSISGRSYFLVKGQWSKKY